MMRQVAILILMVFVVAGCGESPEKRSFRGVQENKNYIAQGMQYLEQEEIAKAIQSFDMAIKQDPANSENYLILGQVYLRLKNLDRAVDSFKAAIRVKPDNGEAYYLLATTQALLSKEGQGEVAVKNLIEARRAAEISVQIFMRNKDEKKFRRSVALLQNLTPSNPADAEGFQPQASPMSSLQEDMKDQP